MRTLNYGELRKISRLTWIPLLGGLAILVSLSTTAFAQAPEALGQAVSPRNWESKTQEFKGKHTLYTFWEVTCEPCVEEMPGLIEVYKQLKPKGLEIVAVNTDPEARFEAAAKLIANLELPFVLLYKEPGSDLKFRQAIDPEYGANPFGMLFNPEGEKIKTFPSAHTEDEWLSLLEPYVEKGEAESAQKNQNQEVSIDLGQNPLGDIAGSFANSPSSSNPGGNPGLDLSNLVPKLESNTAVSQPRGNPFRLANPTWEARDSTSGVLALPFTSAQEAHLLLSTIEYEKLKGKGVSLGDWSVSKLDHLYMEVIDTTEEVLYTPGEVRIPIMIPGAPQGAPASFEMRFTYQGCTDGEGGACFPPDTYIVSGDIESDSQGRLVVSSIKSRHHDPFAPLPKPEREVDSEATGTVESAASPDTVTVGEAPDEASVGSAAASVGGKLDAGLIERTLKKSLFLLFGLAFLGGILTSLTPCVYPMIPATVAIFGAREVKSTAQSISLAATYILGVALSYASLGVIAAAIGAVFGDLMENPWVISIVAIFYVVLALSMLDVFTFYLPSSWVTAATRVNGKGYVPAFMMGLVSSVVFAPCGEPILLGLLTWVAKSRDFFLGFWLLFVYAWGIGVLFFIIAVFSSSMRYLPKAGSWMVAVKDFFGLLLFGLAIYWLRYVLPEMWTLSLLILYLLGAATFIHTKNHDTKGWSRGVLSFATLASLLFATLPLQRVAMIQGWLPSVSSVSTQLSGVPGQSALSSHKERWRTDTPLTDLKQAQAKGRPAIVDFRTNVCPKCDHIEEHVFADGEVQKALEGFATIQVNLSDRDENEEILTLQRKHDVLAVPVIVFYDSEGNFLTEKTVADEISKEDFLRLIKDIG
ncbi:MAG: redoxin domain-containing protein [Candidatus Omnitrophica bacterium]|nr:redoxin domain-containing protein [Candidatus Omnitrophota bacterium]